jgi:hypothetical protein
MQHHPQARQAVRMVSSSRQRRLAVTAALMQVQQLAVTVQLEVTVRQLVAVQRQAVLLLAALCGQQCRMTRGARITTTRRLA